ncbi:PadR family transcriptional regulator [Nocardia asteroides]|uniref:PadR family transcriptional regulator n=1 Tax=Nocardia asteroides TaxID=1824 RepID=UPI001E580658|nr:PadR family transcriptional regulator [Nocardia asteroides]UGT62266.1 PadR family transcriptional regulator [Nocardia asteroides]
MSSPRMTGTSYAVLGLLAVQPWSTYELTRQMERSLGRIWPRAQSRLYEEPKKLVALGFATAEDDIVGRRPRTIYAITDAGRAALARWLREPGAGPVLEFEQLVKLGFADHGTKDDALRTIAAAHSWAEQRNVENLAAAEQYAQGQGLFQYRAAHTMLAGAFFTEFYAMVARWADWAAEQVQTWPENPADAVADPAELAAIARRAAWTPRDVAQPGHEADAD